MSESSDGNSPDKADTPIADASDTIARLRDVAQRRAKQRKARTRGDASAQAELDAVKTHAHTLEAKLAAQTEQLAQVEHAAADLAREHTEEHRLVYEELEGQHRRLKASFDGASKDLEIATKRNEELSAKVAEAEELQYRVNTLEADAKQLRTQMREAQAQIDLNKTAEAAYKELRASHQGLTVEHKSLQEAKEELDSAHATLNAGFNELSNEYELAREDAALVEEAMSQLEQTQFHLREARESADARSAKNAELEAALHHSAEELVAGVQRLEQEKQEHAEIDARSAEEVDALRGQLKTVGDELEALQGKLDNAKAEFDDAKVQAQEAKSEAKNSRAQVAHAQSELGIARTRADKTAERAEVAEANIEAALAEVETARAESQAELEAVRTQANKLQQELSGARQGLKQAAKELETVAQAAAQAEQQMIKNQADWEDAYARDLDNLAQSRAETQLANDELALKHEKLQREMAARQRLRAEFDALKSAVEEQLEADADSGERELQLMAELDLLRASRDEVQQALDALVADREFTKDVTVAQAELERSQSQVGDLEAQLEEARIEIQQVQRDFEGARAAYDEASNRAEQMQAQLQANTAQAANRPKPNQTADAAPKIAQYEAEMAMARSIISNLEEQCEHYETRIAGLQRDLRKAEDAADATSTQNHPHLMAVKRH